MSPGITWVREGESGERRLLAQAAFHCLSSVSSHLFSPFTFRTCFWDISISLISQLCASEAFELLCVFCPEGVSLVLYLVICWLCSFLTLLYSSLMCASLTTRLKNDRGAITFSLLRVKLAALCVAKYTKAGYQSSTAFPV